jgi:hypothetical protein
VCARAGNGEGTRIQNKLVEGVGEALRCVEHDIIISSPLIAQDIHIKVNNGKNKIIVEEQKQARRDDEQYIQKRDKRHDNLNEDVVIEHGIQDEGRRVNQHKQDDVEQKQRHD